MQAITVIPMQAGSARLDDVAEPLGEEGDLLVQTLAVGVCGTDLEISRGGYGRAPPGRDRLVLGHESLGRVLGAPGSSGLRPGDLVVGIVREPDPEPCVSCAAGEWDMCRNGRYTEHGIKQLDGFLRERYRIDSDHVVKLDRLWSGPGCCWSRPAWSPRPGTTSSGSRPGRSGARGSSWSSGPAPSACSPPCWRSSAAWRSMCWTGVTEGPKPDLVADLGATYHTGPVADAVAHADVIVECTGAGELVLDAIAKAGPDGIVCLTGVSSPGRTLTIDPGALNRELVLENGWCSAASTPTAAITRRPRPRWLRPTSRGWSASSPGGSPSAALQRRPDDVKAIVDLSA
jgi:hypothetical protein